MNPRVSSISSSDALVPQRVKAAIGVPLWVAIGLVVIDALINLFLGYPRDPKVTNPGKLRAYFEYGRSTEGQLTRMTRADPLQTAPITLMGWYEPLKIDEFPVKAGSSIVSIYGMSHAVRLGLALARTSDHFTPRIIGAPGATSNWAYGAYLRDRGGGKSRAVVLAFMSQLFPMLTNLSAMTWSVDLPMPYTSDRFYLAANQLKVIHPPYASFAQYVETFYDPVKWAAARDFFAKNDAMYNSFIMRADVLDHSSLFRLIRRAYGQRFLRNARKAVLDDTGFRPESEAVRVANAIIHEFAKRAREDGVIPVIYIVNNLGSSDYLFQALSPILHADNIPYLSSHSIVSPNDPRGYLPDSHFTDAIDDKLAQALSELIDRSN